MVGGIEDLWNGNLTVPTKERFMEVTKHLKRETEREQTVSSKTKLQEVDREGSR